MANPTRSVRPIHFEDFGWDEFERLVFAYHLRTEQWSTLEWYGQLGGDLGRDIFGVREADRARSASVCIQCVDRRRLPFAKAAACIDAACAAPTGKPDEFRFVCGGAVSSKMRDRVRQYAFGKQFQRCDVWSAPEFEERLRRDAESLLKRFVDGVPFPDGPAELQAALEAIPPADDREILSLFARVLDRPAIWTPFHAEANLGDFDTAVADTIQALNTNVWQTREGKTIARIPSRHDLRDPGAKAEMDALTRMLSGLRSAYARLVREGEIRRCGCERADCPVAFPSRRAAEEMDRRRGEIRAGFARLYPGPDHGTS